jgi:hypothetical protein
MYLKRLTFAFFLMLISALKCFSQAYTVEYSYDAAGNRILRRVILIEEKKDTINQANTLVADSVANSLENGEMLADNEVESFDTSAQNYTSQIGDRTILLFPNPTTGILNLVIKNLASADKAFYNIYSQDGRLLYTGTCLSEYSKIDLSSHPKGIYLLDIYLNEKQSAWKIIKQ